MQISNSGNFSTDNIWWTRIFGSINYQIEHHLFPNMSSIHYPVVSKIVKEYCMENNIQYVNKSSIYEAYLSFHKYITYDPIGLDTDKNKY
jgi:linoleoyl-CoA desaturase